MTLAGWQKRKKTSEIFLTRSLLAFPWGKADYT